MDKKIAEQLTELSQKMMDTVTTLQKINDRTVQDLAKQQLEAAEHFIKSGAEQMKHMGSIKTVQDAVTNQAELASEVGKMILSNAQKSMEVLTRGQSELKNLIDQNVKDFHMGVTAENIAERFKISKDEQDKFAVSSQNKAEASQKAGTFKDEIIPIEVPQGRNKPPLVFDTDEFVRKGATIEAIGKIPAAFKRVVRFLPATPRASTMVLLRWF